jgi:hypothetical protein
MRWTCFLIAATALLPSATRALDGWSSPGDALDGLAEARTGRALRQGSNDPSGGNVDFRLLAPGAMLTLLEHQGAGVVRRFYISFLPRRGAFGDPDQIVGGTEADVVAAHRQAILRMYWDGEKTPSVEVPIGDFFAVGFGMQKDFVSLPVSETTGGYSAYWPMPFHRSATITLTNQSPSTQMVVWWNIDYVSYSRLPRGLRHFHAQFRRENPTAAGRPYTILEAVGSGHYVGTALFAQIARLNSNPLLSFVFLEGDEQISIDGESTPSIKGSGHEEYFNGGFYFDHGAAIAPYHGTILKDETRGRVNTYRWHVEDPIPFTRSLHVAIEHGSGNVVEADYSSVAYWYQSEPHAPFPPLPEAEALLPVDPLPAAP